MSIFTQFENGEAEVKLSIVVHWQQFMPVSIFSKYLRKHKNNSLTLLNGVSKNTYLNRPTLCKINDNKSLKMHRKNGSCLLPAALHDYPHISYVYVCVHFSFTFLCISIDFSFCWCLKRGADRLFSSFQLTSNDI